MSVDHDAFWEAMMTELFVRFLRREHRLTLRSEEYLSMDSSDRASMRAQVTRHRRAFDQMDRYAAAQLEGANDEQGGERP